MQKSPKKSRKIWLITCLLFLLVIPVWLAYCWQPIFHDTASTQPPTPVAPITSANIWKKAFLKYALILSREKNDLVNLSKALPKINQLPESEKEAALKKILANWGAKNKKLQERLDQIEKALPENPFLNEYLQAINQIITSTLQALDHADNALRLTECIKTLEEYINLMNSMLEIHRLYQKQAPYILWKITHPNFKHTSYLFGVHHCARPAYTLPSEVQKTLDSVKTFFIECDTLHNYMAHATQMLKEMEAQMIQKPKHTASFFQYIEKTPHANNTPQSNPYHALTLSRLFSI